MKMKMRKIRFKYGAPFVEWYNRDIQKWCLSRVSWKGFLGALMIKLLRMDLSDFKWHWVPPWRVQIG